MLTDFYQHSGSLHELLNKVFTVCPSLLKDALGTCVLFEEGPQTGKALLHTVYCVPDIHLFIYVIFFPYPSFWHMCAGKADSGPELKYMCHTVKKLMMQRIFLTEKKEGETSTGQPAFCVIPTGGSDADEHDTTCQSTQEENENQQGETEEEMHNTDIGGSAVG